MLLKLDNVKKIDVHFNWNLMTNDPEDNKYVDCAISASAQFIVSNDKHFKILDYHPFPPLSCINAKDFLEFLKSQ